MGTTGTFVKETTIVRKTANETITNSDVLQNDDALVVPIAANEILVFRVFARYEAGDVGGIKIAINGPAGSSLYAVHSILTNTILTVFRTSTLDAALVYAAADDGAAILEGTLVNGATAGNLTFRWAQGVAHATGTIVYAGSYLRAERV
jgi:hypothetical protein